MISFCGPELLVLEVYLHCPSLCAGPELSQKISENAFVCIYLVFQLTELVTITGTVASLAGSTHR